MRLSSMRAYALRLQAAERSHMEKAYALNSSKFIDLDDELGKRGKFGTASKRSW